MTTIDPQHFRDVMGHYPTGVSVITAIAADGQALAMVVGTFASVSLDPPLVSFMPTRTSTSFAQLREAERFVVNILAHDQEAVVRRLARSDRHKMDAESWQPSPATGAPILDGVVAAIECDTHSVLDAGDHYIVLGAVTRLQTVRPTIPLLFFRGGYGEFAPKSFVATEGRGLSGAVAQAQTLRGRIERAAHDFGGEVTVFGRISGDSVALATAPGPGGDQITPLGTRYPIAPPIGAQYVAWGDERDQDVWIDKAIGATPTEREGYREHLADAREHGWSVSVVPDDGTEWPEDFTSGDVEDLIRGRHAEITRRMVGSARAHDVGDIDPDGSYRVIGLMAPIFTSDQAAPELMVRILIYPTRLMSGAEIHSLGAALRDFSTDAAEELRAALATT